MEKTRRTITNFIKNKYSRNDYVSIHKEFEKNNQEGTFFAELENQWNGIDPNQASKFHQENAWGEIQKRTKPHFKRKALPLWQFAQRAAAILFIPLFLTSLFYFYSVNNSTNKNAYAEIECPAGVRTNFQLPDGTTGYLNGGSSLKYLLDFKNSRNVSIEGEAYLDVFHDKNHPFVVQTQNLNVKVLGTKFNVIAYEEELSEQIVLDEGRVEVLSRNGKQLLILEPNQKLTLDKDEMTYRKEDVNVNKYISWTEGKLMFRNDKLHVVIARLSRWYNVDFELEDERLLNYSFRATFVDEPIEEVFKLLSISAPLTFEEKERESSRNDEYQKRKIIIKLDEKRINAFKK